MKHATPIADRFWPKVDRRGEEECWPWLAALHTEGYGVIGAGGQRGATLRAHRVSYELANGPIPDGVYVDHLCHNRCCVNPAHLRLATHQQNEENRAGASIRSKSGIRGVSPHKQTGKWAVWVAVRRQHHYGGLYTDLAEAEQVAIAMRNRLHTHNARDRS